MKSLRTIATVSEQDFKSLDLTVQDSVDIFEIRLDLFSEDFLFSSGSSLFEGLQKPILFTYRDREDSSEPIHISHTFSKRWEELLQKFNSPDNFLDLDTKHPNPLFPRGYSLSYSLIHSYHDFLGVVEPDLMKDLIGKYQEDKTVSLGPKVFKFACKPKSQTEALRFLSSGIEFSQSHSLALIAMGKEFSYTRIFADQFGSKFTYCTIEFPKAPGQIRAQDLWEIRRLTGLESH